MQCEKCKTTENVVINNHPKAKFKCLCKNCVEQFLSKKEPDWIAFTRLFSQKEIKEGELKCKNH